MCHVSKGSSDIFRICLLFGRLQCHLRDNYPEQTKDYTDRFVPVPNIVLDKRIRWRHREFTIFIKRTFTLLPLLERVALNAFYNFLDPQQASSLILCVQETYIIVIITYQRKSYELPMGFHNLMHRFSTIYPFQTVGPAPCQFLSSSIG